MRAIWKGAVSFGLVSIPVKLYSATEEKGISFHQVHAADGGRIKYKRTCSVDGEEVPYSDIAKGYELPNGETIVLTDSDFADLPLKASREIDVLEFVPADEVDPVLFNKTYYLEPDGKAVKPYVLLREALSSTDRVAVVKVALRQREALAALRIREGVIVLQTLLWPDEVREPSFGFLDDDVTLRPQELAMAASLVESMASDFDPAAYTDEYREALQTVIDAKEGRAVAPAADAGEPTGGGKVVDLMSALQASVDRARSGRGETAADGRAAKESAPAPATKAPAAKSAAKKAPAKQSTAAKKAPAKRSAAESTGKPAAKSNGKKAAPAKKAVARQRTA
jgi:DNA end-binding protein Ku